MTKRKQRKIKITLTESEAESIFDVMRQTPLKRQTTYSVKFLSKLNEFIGA